jgi:hypothetical protein
MTLQSIQQAAADVQITAQLVDRKGLVKAVMVQVAPAAATTIVPDSDGMWPSLPEGKEVELLLNPETKSASGRMQIALSGQGPAARKILVQTAHRYRSRQVVYSSPKEYDLPGKPGRIPAPGAPMEWILKTARRESFGLFEPLVDPDNDCKLVKDDVGYKFKIEIPGGVPHTLTPDGAIRLDTTKPLHDAPMCLISVEGDFAALVKVTGEIGSRGSRPIDRQGDEIPFTYQGAGLLLYQDRNNFVRVERAALVEAKTLQPIQKILFEVVKDGKRVHQSDDLQVPAGPVYLLLVRRNGRVIFGASANLAAPPIPVMGINLDLPPNVQVGLSASNISAKPFSATFENFALLNDLTVIDAKFGNDTQ